MWMRLLSPWLEGPAEGGQQKPVRSIFYKGHPPKSKCFCTALQETAKGMFMSLEMLWLE